jgi:hypothetical protein
MRELVIGRKAGQRCGDLSNGEVVPLAVELLDGDP